MDPKENLCAHTWARSSSLTSRGNGLQVNLSSDSSSFPDFSLQHNQQKWEDPSIIDYGIGIEAPFNEFDRTLGPRSLIQCDTNNVIKIPDQENCEMSDASETAKLQDWDPGATLNSLSFLKGKIHELQDLVHVIVGRKGQQGEQQDEVPEQQLITANLTSIIAQLVSTAGSLLPSVRHALVTTSPSVGQLGQPRRVTLPSGSDPSNSNHLLDKSGNKISDRSNRIDPTNNREMEQKDNMEEHQPKDEEDADEGENLPPGSFEILQLEKEEILVPHTHFCTICGKGFKRDANLRMHMRGHGDEYKNPAALAKPNKESESVPKLIKRYSCPYAGCKRNKDHKKFQPLKTILCVKNHYKRTHCDKSYTCSRCHTKKFSVMADLKTHEKHCGKDKWLCSCGTTFSRKDKLFGHIALFQGHIPAIPLDDAKGTAEPLDPVSKEDTSEVGSINLSFGSNPSDNNGVQDMMETKGNMDDPINYFSPLNFENSNFGGYSEFPRPLFEDPEGGFPFLMPGSFSYTPKPGGESSSDNLL